MRLIDSLWRVGPPLVVVAIAASLLVAAIRAPAVRSRVPRPYAWLAAAVWLTLAGDAALGERRPAFERQWKGATALLLGLAVAVYLWKRHRLRATEPPEGTPAEAEPPAPPQARAEAPKPVLAPPSPPPAPTQPPQTARTATQPPARAAATARAEWHSHDAVPVTMPALGGGVVEGTVTRWFKEVGDTVRVGEPLFEVSTDKVDVEVPAEVSGTLRDVTVAVGGTAPVGAPIAAIVPTG